MTAGILISACHTAAMCEPWFSDISHFITVVEVRAIFKRDDITTCSMKCCVNIEATLRTH